MLNEVVDTDGDLDGTMKIWCGIAAKKQNKIRLVSVRIVLILH